MRSNYKLWYDRFFGSQLFPTREELIAFQIAQYGSPHPADQLNLWLCFYKKVRACELLREGNQPYALLDFHPDPADPSFPDNR